MTASEIAETLLNGNIAQARHAILNGNDAYACEANSEYAAAATALDVADELAYLMEDHCAALRKVRRCLEGAP